MSASREKQNRQDLAEAGVVDPSVVDAAEKKKKEKRTNALYTAIGVAFLIVAIMAVVWRSNIIPKKATAATIDGEKYTAGEVSFYYHNSYISVVNSMSYMLSYIGLDTNSPLETQTVNETAAAMLGIEAGQTWHEFFLESGLNQMATIQTALKQAEAEGFVYPDSVQEQYQANIDGLDEMAASYGMTVEQLISSNFGTMVTEDIYNEHLLRMMQYSAYSAAHEDSLTYSDSEIQATYEADPDSYDTVSYEYVFISGAAESTTDAEGNAVQPTEEESAAALAEAEAMADKMLADYQAGGDLKALAEGNEKANYSKVETGAYSGTILTEWLFDEARKPGDSTVLTSGTAVYVAVFHDRFLEDYNTIDIRHILIQPEAGTLTAQDEGYEAEQENLKAAAKARAEEIYAQWKAGEATEDSFAELAKAESSDGSKYEGGLYTQVAQGQMVTAFNDWCFADGRKSGDNGIVETEYGYHIMYFVGENLPYWKTLVTYDLKTVDYSEWETSLSADCTIDRGGMGMKFVR